MSTNRWELMIELGKRSGAILLDFFQKPFKTEFKSKLDMVTEADIASEKYLKAAILQAFPRDSILAEEEGSQTGTSGYRWIIDPLDGTTNFSHGLAHFAVSIAIEYQGQIIAGLVFDPSKGELFSAKKNEGAWLNGKAIHCSKINDPDRALSVSGFPYNRREQLPKLLDGVQRALNHFQGLRRLGAAALDLAYVASGRFDVFWEANLKPWDLAAGILLVQEAGGKISGLEGEPFQLDKGDVLASNADLHDLAVTLF